MSEKQQQQQQQAPQQQQQQTNSAQQPSGGAAAPASAKEEKKVSEPEIAVDTASGSKGSGVPPAAGWGGSGVMVFSAPPMMGGDYHDMSWMPPPMAGAAGGVSVGGSSDPDFKGHNGHGKQQPNPVSRPPANRPGSRRYAETYGDDEDVVGYDPRRINAMGQFAVSAMAEDVTGEDEDSDGDDEFRMFHLNPQRQAMVAAYRGQLERSVADNAELFTMLRDASDIRELDMDILESILLNGREKQSVETLEKVIHALCDIMRETIQRIEPGPHPAPAAAPAPSSSSSSGPINRPSGEHKDRAAAPKAPQQNTSQPQNQNQPKARPPQQPQQGYQNQQPPSHQQQQGQPQQPQQRPTRRTQP